MDYTEALRRMAIVDTEYVDALLHGQDTGLSPASEDKVVMLARIAALAGSRAPAHAYAVATHDAVAAGASASQIVDVLAKVAPIIGSASLAAAAPALALALGYDTEVALERPDGSAPLPGQA